ncbi:unnamed protein product [Alopecurus aequalis]
MAGRRSRAKEVADPKAAEDAEARIARAAAQATMIMMGMQSATPMFVPPTPAASSNGSAARPCTVPDAHAATPSPAPMYGFLPGRAPTAPILVPDMGDSTPTVPRAPFDLNTAPVSGVSIAPSSKGGRRDPPANYPEPRNLFDEMQSLTQGLTTKDGEEFLVDMINENGHGDYGEEWGEGDGEENEGDEVQGTHIDEMPLFMDKLTQQAQAAKKRRPRGIGYTEADDKCLCETCMQVGQNTIVRAEMKGNAYWGRIYKNYHERAVLPPYSMVTKRTEMSIQKQFGLISSECSKFTGSFEHAATRPQSGVGIADLAFQALEVYKTEHGDKSFNFAHCYKLLKDNQKWKELHNILKRGRGKLSVPGMTAGNGDDTKTKRPSVRTNSKLDLKRDVTTIALQETLKGFINQKDKTSEKKDERDKKKRWEREELTKNFFIVQSKKLEIEEENARTRAKEADTRAMEAEIKKKEVELALATQEAQIMAMELSSLTPRKKAYFEKKQQCYMDAEE